MESNDDKKATGAGTVGGAVVGGVAGGAAAGAAAGGVTGPVGAAVGAAVGAGIGAASGHGAAKAKDGSTRGGMGHTTVIGAFDDAEQAQRAVDRLAEQGFDRSDVHVERGEQAMEQRTDARDEKQEKGGFFSWLFGDSEHHQSHRSTYGEAVRRGSSVVVVDVRDDAEAQRAVSCLHELGAIDVDQRAQQWRNEGWSDRPATALKGDGSKEGVLDVVQEELQIGKRQLEKGGVRVIQRVSEKPVREVVRLREEKAVVDRRPVDREATAGDLNAFKEGTLEVRETVEEPVVAKRARVVEEVRVGKEVREREQTVEDTVRRKDVEVQQMDGSRVSERERAMASNDLRREGGLGTSEREREIAQENRDLNRDLTDKPRDR